MKSLIMCLLLVWLSPPVSADDKQLLDLARRTIAKARYATLATVDVDGQPRTRIVDPFVPDAEFVIYVATRPNTRKVAQIKQHDQVTLFYFDPQGRNYVSVMGKAELIEDKASKIAMRREADSARIYPDFPDDYLLIRIRPDWLEGLLPGFRGDPETWMPARANFSARGSSAK
ncbi:MAG: pyridoxamine 5'-phosphate oxidase family protein [Pseudomonadales bacterium]